jgi:hypothetical protein
MLCLDPRLYTCVYIYICIYVYMYREREGEREIDRWKLTKNSGPKIAIIPYYRRFSQTELFGFIFSTMVDQYRFANDSRENETKKFGLGKPVVIWD